MWTFWAPERRNVNPRKLPLDHLWQENHFQFWFILADLGTNNLKYKLPCLDYWALYNTIQIVIAGDLIDAKKGAIYKTKVMKDFDWKVFAYGSILQRHTFKMIKVGLTSGSLLTLYGASNRSSISRSSAILIRTWLLWKCSNDIIKF